MGVFQYHRNFPPQLLNLLQTTGQAGPREILPISQEPLPEVLRNIRLKAGMLRIKVNCLGLI